MTEHKHAEVLRAIADGREVQWATSAQSNNWLTVRPENEVNPITYSHFEWRVAPPAWQEALRQAVRDGKVVEYECGGSWHHSALNDRVEDFSWGDMPQDTYRIRPEPKPDVVRYIQKPFSHVTNEWYETINPVGIEYITITRDGETGKLKSAEVLP